MIDSNFERLWMYVDATNIDHLYSHTNHHRSMSNQTPHIHFFLFIQWTQPSGAATFTSYTFCHEVISHHLHYLVANLGWPASGAICINYNFLFLFSNAMFHSSQMDGYKSQNQKSEKILGKCLLRKMCPFGVASTAGCCLGSFHAPLRPIHGHIRTQCLRMEWTMDTWRPQTREHKDLWQAWDLNLRL